MRYVRCEIRHLEQRCKQRGYALGPALACISQSGDGFIVVDTDHPAYPKATIPDAARAKEIAARVDGTIAATKNAPCCH